MGGCIPLNIVIIIFLIELGVAQDAARIFAYVSAVHGANLCVEIYTIIKTGYTKTPVTTCYIILITILWLVVLLNGVFNGYLAYQVLAPLSKEGKSAEEILTDTVLKSQRWLGPVSIMEGVLNIIGLLTFHIFSVKMRDRTAYDKEIELTGLSRVAPMNPLNNDSKLDNT